MTRNGASAIGSGAPRQPTLPRRTSRGDRERKHALPVSPAAHRPDGHPGRALQPPEPGTATDDACCALLASLLTARDPVVPRWLVRDLRGEAGEAWPR